MPSWGAKELIFSKIGYIPTPDQEAIHRDDHRIKEIAGGERGGKSTTASKELISQHWLGDLYWLVGADYDLCRPEFAYLLDDFTKLGIVKSAHFPSRDQCSLDIALEGAKAHIETKSAKYPERLAAQARMA